LRTRQRLALIELFDQDGQELVDGVGAIGVDVVFPVVDMGMYWSFLRGKKNTEEALGSIQIYAILEN
jgi:hypothetical protein